MKPTSAPTPLNSAFLQFAPKASILLQQTLICLTPIVKSTRACSLVYPSFYHIDSNSFVGEAIIRIVISA